MVSFRQRNLLTNVDRWRRLVLVLHTLSENLESAPVAAVVASAYQPSEPDSDLTVGQGEGVREGQLALFPVGRLSPPPGFTPDPERCARCLTGLYECDECCPVCGGEEVL
jgi:hypothetical protein